MYPDGPETTAGVGNSVIALLCRGRGPGCKRHARNSARMEAKLPVFVVFVIWPLIEIALFVTIGAKIGLAATLAVVLGSGVLGSVLLRGQGVVAARQMRGRSFDLRQLGGVMGDQILRAIAAILLILPGFLTDALGLLLLIGPVRRLVLRLLLARVRSKAARRDGDVIIDGEYTIVAQPAFPRPGDDTRPPQNGLRD
ncbi:MAG: FxsA family protein [Rhodobacteraceae bacterium]|nr:FxsA family protein [Paracoccaceae bacterium]